MSLNSSSPARKDLSAAFITHLSANGLLVGYCQAPTGGGWDKQPNLDGSKYNGYVTVWPLAANTVSGPFEDSGADWQVPYQIISYGIDPAQTENQSDLTRKRASALLRNVLTLDGDPWQVVQVRTNTIGAMARNDNFEPPEFSQIDILTLWISKEL